MNVELKFEPYEAKTRERKLYPYEKFVEIVKAAKKADYPAVAIKWETVKKLVGFTSKPHSVFARKKRELFVDQEGNKHSIKQIEDSLNVRIIGNRDRDVMAVIKQ